MNGSPPAASAGSDSSRQSAAAECVRGAGITGQRTEHCQGRSFDGDGRRVRPCARPPTLRVTGSGMLTADLCTQHARGAIDRPRLVADWLGQEGPDSAGADRARAALLPGDGPLDAEADLVLRVFAELASLSVARAALSRALRREGWPDELHALVLLAVGEALANAVEHGSSAGAVIQVELTVDADHASVRVADEGRLGAAVPLTIPPLPPLASPRGRGLLLMLGLAEEVEVRSRGAGTSLLLRFERPAEMAGGGGGPA